MCATRTRTNYRISQIDVKIIDDNIENVTLRAPQQWHCTFCKVCKQEVWRSADRPRLGAGVVAFLPIQVSDECSYIVHLLFRVYGFTITSLFSFRHLFQYKHWPQKLQLFYRKKHSLHRYWTVQRKRNTFLPTAPLLVSCWQKLILPVAKQIIIRNVFCIFAQSKNYEASRDRCC
jgi:hypothetical protein